MKKFMLIVLVGVALYGNDADVENMQKQMFVQMKSMILMKTKVAQPKMKEMRRCFASANSKNQAIKCGKIMDEFSEDEDDKSMQKDDNFKWNAKAKKEILADVDEAIKHSNAVIKCLKKSNDMTSFAICTQKAGIE